MADGKLKDGIIHFAGANTHGWMSNLSMKYDAGTLSILDIDGNPLTPANPGYSTLPSTTHGKVTPVKVYGTHSFNDDAHASSDLTNLGFGITEAAHWAQDVPFFVYQVNVGNYDIDGTDGHSCFAIARNPAMRITPSSADDIGNTSAIPTNDSQTVILLMGNYTVASYTSKPCRLVGCFRMQWSTTSDDWTVQTFDARDGLGEDCLNKMFASYWTFPGGQNGGNGSGHMKAATAPTFTGEVFLYKIRRDGIVECYVNFSGNTATDGSTGVTAACALPYSCDGFGSDTVCFAVCYLTYAGTVSIGLAEVQQNTTNMDFFNGSGVALTNGDFADGNRVIDVTMVYKAF